MEIQYCSLAEIQPRIKVRKINNFEKVTNGDYMSLSSKESTSASVRDGWNFEAPAYEGGILAANLYDAGTGLKRDNGCADLERSYMMSVSNTSKNEFNAYTAKLLSCGYVLDSENSMDAPRYSELARQTNLYRLFRKDGKVLYTYFNAAIDQVRIIEDPVSVPESGFEYVFGYNVNTPVEVYMYGMKYHPQGLQFCDVGGDPDTANNGSFFIIKQADNSVILIDGGAQRQATGAAVEGLWEFLHQITEKDEGEPIAVACWFVSHPHEDHYSLVHALIDQYHSQLDLQRVMFNFPNPEQIGFEIYDFRGKIEEYYSNVKFLKPHAGQSIQMGSVLIDVLATHEDLVSAITGKTLMTEGNSMSTILRFTMPDGTSFLNLGDFTKEAQEVLEDVLSASEWRCEILAVAHHGYNMITKTYESSDANYALWPNYRPDEFTEWHLEVTTAVKERLINNVGIPESNIYYAGNNTVKLECQNGEVTVSLFDPVY